MTTQSNDTSSTAYVDDGETLHEGGPFTCFCCGNPNATRISDYGFAWCRNCQQAAPWESMRGEYRRRVANQFAKIFPSLREEPEVERAEEPLLKFIEHGSGGRLMLAGHRITVAQLLAELADDCNVCEVAEDMSLPLEALRGMLRETAFLLDRHPSRPEEIGEREAVQAEGESVSDIDMNDLLPAFRGEPPLMGACRVFARDAANSQHAMTLAHLVAVLAALTPEQRHAALDRVEQDKARADRAEQALAAAHDVLRAAVAWWRTKRPVSFDQAEHLANPTINTTTPAEKRLAKVVASCVAPKEQDA